MPHATTVPGHRGPRRRAVLAGGLAVPLAAALLDGCSGASRPAPAEPAGTASRRRAGRDSADLLAQYDAAIAAHPALGAGLRPLRSQVARHLAAFAAGAGAVPPAGAGRTAAADPATALSELAATERRVAQRRTSALAAAPPELAILLASAAAAGACHVNVLGALKGGS